MPLRLQNEISEVFDKLHHVNVNGSDSAIEVIDTIDSNSASPKPLIKEKPILRKLNNVDAGVKSGNIEDWNSLAQFEKLIKREMENLAAVENNQKSNVATPLLSTTKMTSNNSNSNILKPEKHVSISL